MKIILFVADNASDNDHDLIQACIQRVRSRGNRDPELSRHGITIHSGLAPDDICKAEIVFDCDEHGNWVPNQSMVVGVVQRQPGAAFEFHS